MQQVTRELNLVRAMMNTMIQWYIDMDMPRKVHIVADATMFDVGLLAPEVNGLHQIRLNLSANAVKNFYYGDHSFSFNCGYNRQDAFVDVPYAAVLGFIIPTSENTESFCPIPNMHREMEMLARTQVMRNKLEELTTADHMPTMDELVEALAADQAANPAKALVAEPYAVHGVDPDQPTHTQLMTRLPMAQRTKEPVKEKVEPLLNFGEVSNYAFPKHIPKRRAAASHLRLIQGGKA